MGQHHVAYNIMFSCPHRCFKWGNVVSTLPWQSWDRIQQQLKSQMQTLLINLEKYAKNGNTLTQTVNYEYIFKTFFLWISVYFYWIWSAKNYRGKIIHTIIHTLIRSSFCAFNFKLPTHETKFCLGCQAPHKRLSRHDLRAQMCSMQV